MSSLSAIEHTASVSIVNVEQESTTNIDEPATNVENSGKARPKLINLLD